MLCLTRREGGELMIGDNIRIVIDRIHENKVAIAIEAPRELPVHRKEVYDAIHRGLDDSRDRSGG